MTESDIQNTHIFLKALPSWLRPYGVLMRLDRPIGWWLLLIPGWWGLALGGLQAGQSFPFNAFLLFFIGAIVMRGAGCIINDIWDRDLDKSVARTAGRPLASGQVSVEMALFFLGFLLLIGLMILLQFDVLTIILGCLSLPFIAAYPYMKRITYWPQAFLGLTFNFGVLMGWSAMTEDLPTPALLLYIGAIFWTLGYDTIYAHQDKEDDVLIGIKSTAIILAERSRQWVATFYMMSWLLIAMAVFMVKGLAIFSIILMASAALHMVFQIKTWDLSRPESALRIFKSNRNFGLIVLIAMIF